MPAEPEPVIPAYLRPYHDATRRHGAGFGALLWASPLTQGARFGAICELVDLSGKSILDVGCGRGDFLDYLLNRGITPQSYVGIEQVPPLAEAAEVKVAQPRVTQSVEHAAIIRADFLTDPAKMFVGADVVMLSGSLNTAEDQAFYTTLRRAFDAAAETFVFNFLCSPELAGADYLRWRDKRIVERFASTLAKKVRLTDRYLPGDCTIAVFHEDAG